MNCFILFCLYKFNVLLQIQERKYNSKRLWYCSLLIPYFYLKDSHYINKTLLWCHFATILIMAEDMTEYIPAVVCNSQTGTVRTYPNFNAEKDAEDLRNAMEGLGEHNFSSWLFIW